MALIKDLEHKGVQIKNCYIKIMYFGGNKDVLHFAVSLHSERGSPILHQMDCSCPHDLCGGNVYQQGYAHLKGNDFAGATDVLEQ